MTTPEWHQQIERYATAMRAAGRSPGTVRLHRHYLRRLAQWVGELPPAAVGTDDLRDVLGGALWAPETRKSAVGVFRGFFRWLHGVGDRLDDPALPLETVRVPASAARPTPELMVKQSLQTADPRTRLMILFAAYAGLRCAEIAQVAGHHFDGRLWLDVVGKGGKHRRVPVIHPELIYALALTPGPLFPSPAAGREHLTPGTVTKLLSRALPAHWTGHTLRHRMATRAYQDTGDLIHLGLVLGHARPETTRRYVQPSEDKMLAVIRAAAG